MTAITTTQAAAEGGSANWAPSQRDLFEREAQLRGLNTYCKDGQYMHRDTSLAWEMWQANATLLDRDVAFAREAREVLLAVQEQFRRFWNRMPDGLDTRLFGWVDDVLAQADGPTGARA